jgi:small subunit ribosomal protein S5
MAEIKEKNKENLFVDHVVDVRRVTKVTKGGKNFSFSALVVSGNREGKIGIALGKSLEVSQAIAKATNKARKNMIEIPLRGATIPYPVEGRHGASSVIIRSAYKGTGIIAGGAVRSVMDALGVKDVLAKSLGSSNRQNVVKATLNALAKLRSANHLARLRDTTINDIVGRGGSRGGTSGKGHKGQSARSGGGPRVGFEGGQMPYHRRLPKRGFTNARFSAEVEIVNLQQLNDVFEDGAHIDRESLVSKGLVKFSKSVKGAAVTVKVLGDGTLTKKLVVSADAFSKSAVKAIESLGGEVHLIKES